jgi:uncharacterized protein YndB with AHSA1/START domain
MTEDRIEREIVIAASPERVWALITEPAHLDHWFSPGGPAQVDLRSGGTMLLNHGDHGTFPTRVVKVDPPHYLSYRWASAFPGQEATDSNSTLVEFTLIPDGEGTRLKLIESGFASLVIPSDRPDASYESHSKGWPEVLGNLHRYAEGARE